MLAPPSNTCGYHLVPGGAHSHKSNCDQTDVNSFDFDPWAIRHHTWIPRWLTPLVMLQQLPACPSPQSLSVPKPDSHTSADPAEYIKFKFKPRNPCMLACWSDPQHAHVEVEKGRTSTHLRVLRARSRVACWNLTPNTRAWTCRNCALPTVQYTRVTRNNSHPLTSARLKPSACASIGGGFCQFHWYRIISPTLSA